LCVDANSPGRFLNPAPLAAVAGKGARSDRLRQPAPAQSLRLLADRKLAPPPRMPARRATHHLL